ncbi:hypothetical protein LWI29_005384 [Acer saccharum]|uniref:GATA-type domain-containing protein n=1 Tax=Acer saccharum TaxID=4024 RepID=A0AA39TI79_ACESA|nr:hypothetical protein LWI29_005384 [Acer saccharum]KAK1569069.1 hypothetical protein Q3G72_032166 [Acer saccharum]
MEPLETAAGFMDDLLDFSSDVGEEDDDEGLNNNNKRTRTALTPNSILNPSPPFPESAEEELEWLSNKDAFPGVETFVDVLCNPVIPKHQSPVSVLENTQHHNNSRSSSTSTSTNSSTITSNNGSKTIMNSCGNFIVPVRARSKGHRTRRRDFQCKGTWWCIEEKAKNVKPVVVKVSIGRKCQHCGAEKTPQWRAGPLGPKTLCNACGVRYKSGRLVPEYRPASSPTFSTELHSNSHRKVVEMRKQKQMMGMESCWG